MTPTLFGRVQTRILIGFGFGAPVAFVIAMLAPAASGRLSTFSTMTLLLVITIVLGLFWEAAYHLAQQLRSDRDWPSGLALLVGLPELFVVRETCVVMGWIDTMTLQRFVLSTAAIWIGIWLASQSVVRVIDPMWRFRGGRLLARDQ